jgi:class 3 adenylate cyclase/tetratricopeptide (TPR) repeat protein
MCCPSCGFDNPEGVKFCGECGTPLTARCPACGFANPPRFKFCGECGASIGPPSRLASPPTLAAQPQPPSRYTPAYLAEKILTSKAALEGERKQVTVLFADLKGSMELLADRDPEEARAILDPVLERMMAAVHRYEGTVNQVMGDGIMALFGAPIAHEDHAIRACYAALAMQTSVQQYAAEVQRTRGVPLHIRVGLNSGEVVVRSIGSDLHMDYTAVGQTTHLAARMEQMAMPGTILITPAVLGLVEGYVQVTSLGPVPIKGLSTPLEVYEVTGAGLVRTRLQAASMRGLSRFVGRDTELDILRQALERAGDGQGQVVAVIGEPGVGKSRLFWEFTQSHRTQGWLILESRSVSYGKAAAYLPVIELLKAYCQIEDRDGIRRVREQVTGKLLTLDRALEPMLPAILALLDVPVEDDAWQALDPQRRRRQTLEAVKRLLIHESHVQPVLVVFEDLHWIDTETQAVLDRLVDSLPTARVLLLVNYRPEYQHGWGSKTCYSQLRLDPLPAASAEELLQTLLGNDSGLDPLRPRLIAQTQGNPFFLEESVRTLVETGVLVGERRAYRLEKPLDTFQIPVTVQALLAARIDRLPPEDKRLLQTAAVIGTKVPGPLLQVIAELPEEALHPGLAHLQAAEFLYETRLFPEPEYMFKHALTHEVAYGSLLQGRRRVLHARIVEALETLAPERVAEQIERLAHHALRGEVWDKAVTYCQQAGARARDRAAFREAAASFEQALQSLAHLPEPGDTRELAIELRLALGDALTQLGEYGRRLALLGEAEALARALDDWARLGRVLAGMAHVLRRTGHSDGAMAAGQQALELAAELGDRALQVQVSYYLGQAYYFIGDFGRAAELLRRNVEAADGESGTPSTSLLIQSQAWLAFTLSALGAFAEGRRHGEEALRLATLVGRGATPIIVHGRLGTLYLAQGDLEHTIRVLEPGLALCRASGYRGGVLRVIAAGLGYAYALQGRLAEGRGLLEEAISESLRTGALENHALWVAWLSEVCRLAGRGEEAWQHARQALDLARQQKARGDEAHALHHLGVVHTHADPPDDTHADPPDDTQAEAHYRKALALAEELGMRPLIAHCHRGLGTLYAKTGQREQTRAELSIAIEFYRSMEMTFWLPQTETALAQVEGR